MVNEDVYKPDVCVISKERYSTQVEPVEPGGKHLVLKGSPELVVEIRSPSNRRTQERKKRRNYFESGALVIWDVDYEKRKIWVYEVTNPDKSQEYTEKDEISCEPILGEWKRKVGDFFSKDLSAEQVVGEAANEWRAEALREVVLLQVQARFGKDVPVELATRLKRYNLGQLMQVATTLATAPNLGAWLKALPD